MLEQKGWHRRLDLTDRVGDDRWPGSPADGR
jgi:hypothetical protein